MYSPTGYWALRSWDDRRYEILVQLTKERAQEQGRPYHAPRRTEILPVVTWSSDGWACVFDEEGKLTQVNKYPGAELFVMAAHPDEE